MFGRQKREEAAAAEAVREEERRQLFARLAQRPENICPFLGLEGERAGFVEGVSDEHRCFAFGEPTPLSAEQQTRVCQERGYGNCPRYLRGVLVIPTEELEALRQRRGLAPREEPSATPIPKEPSASRFPAILWVGILLLIVSVGGVGAFFVLGGNRPVAQATPTPSPMPSVASEAPATPDATPTGTPLPTPPPVAWEWVECAPGEPCADENITREQMANFLANARDLGPELGEDAFTDIAGSEYRGQINAVAIAGLTLGCTPTEYCPTGIVTNEQLATFIQRAFDIPPSDTNAFTDDNDSIHENAINALAAAGIAEGCGGTNFCPRDEVTRAVAAAYLNRAINR